MIAKQFASDIRLVDGAQIWSVAGRNFEKTKAFAEKKEIPHARRDIEEVLSDENVDVVYIATPHPSHFELMLEALSHGKHVLCEKPFTINYQQAKQVIETARQKKLFVMEAMWTRFLPAIVALRDRLVDREIGEVLNLELSMGYRFDPEKFPRVFDLKLGGGGLLDMGVYCVSFAQMIFSDRSSNQPYIQPKTKSFMQLGKTGVDERVSWVSQFPSGGHVVSSVSLLSPLSHTAVISGENGSIKVPDFWSAKELHFEKNSIDFKYQGMGLQFQIEHVCEQIQNGRTESEIMPLQDTLSVMQTMDEIRHPWGLRYPCE